MINFKIKNDNFFEVEIDGRPTEVYPRVYVSRITTTDRVKIYSLDLNRTLFDSIDYRDFSISGVVATDGAKAMNALNEIIYKNIADVVPPLPVAPKIIQSIPMQDATGLLVWKNILDNGTETYTLQNGTVYSGSRFTLLPYAKSIEKTEYSITTFAVSGAYDYLLTKSQHEFKIIQTIEIGEGQTFNAYANYNILPNDDLIINSSVAFPNTYFVRITGIRQ
jgi:hypothetical protein